MKRPDEAIERMRAIYGDAVPWERPNVVSDIQAILAYLDSHKWPDDLDKARMMELARDLFHRGILEGGYTLQRLAELAPEREKRMVELWMHASWNENDLPQAHYIGRYVDGVGGWRKVGGPFEIEG